MNTIPARLVALEKLMHSRSPKPLARLKASMAAAEYKALKESLPGSARRGLYRGKEI